MRLFSTLLLVVLLNADVFPQQHSVARRWNEVLLEAIRNDFARPTVHGRNLFHTSVALYDSWAIFDPVAETYMLGKVVHGFDCPYNGIASPVDVQAAQEETMSYAAYRLLSHRFANSPGATGSQFRFDTLMTNLGYDINFTSVDYSNGSYAALGNHLAENLILFGLQDGANEAQDYENEFYESQNPTLIPVLPGNPDIEDPNLWQPLTLQIYIDQSGNVYPINTPDFLSPEWGVVAPFALSPDDLTINTRDGNDYWLYHDPGTPPLMDTADVSGTALDYQWSFELVAVWSSHLSSADPTIWDISPASIGNIQSYPTNFNQHQHFYDLDNGGDVGVGRTLNPATGQPYTPQYVKRGDYARVLAEFWADGPDSETPPGHWFTILNYVNDHQDLEKRYEGVGPILPDLEWDVKAYFTMAGAVHDAAVTAWGAKGWYDYIRPISAIRFMADLGQSTDPNRDSYHPAGLKLIENVVELVKPGDPLAGGNNEHVGKIKLNCWKGPDYITDPEVDEAGTGWILAENWWPYQRPSFVTPPFAGYVSGHSTFSRAAAEVMTSFTGDEFFPGGMGEFHAPMNEFLVFEEGPSTDVVLQWATYRDASDQCSLSRIWGGIHPTIDDIPGRLMGIEIGNDAFALAKEYFEGNSVITTADEADQVEFNIYPNPVAGNHVSVSIANLSGIAEINLYSSNGKICLSTQMNTAQTNVFSLDVSSLSNGVYLLQVSDNQNQHTQRLSIMR